MVDGLPLAYCVVLAVREGDAGAPKWCRNLRASGGLISQSGAMALGMSFLTLPAGKGHLHNDFVAGMSHLI
jgi:hypothetical protein